MVDPERRRSRNEPATDVRAVTRVCILVIVMIMIAAGSGCIVVVEAEAEPTEKYPKAFEMDIPAVDTEICNIINLITREREI